MRFCERNNIYIIKHITCLWHRFTEKYFRTQSWKVILTWWNFKALWQSWKLSQVVNNLPASVFGNIFSVSNIFEFTLHDIEWVIYCDTDFVQLYFPAEFLYRTWCNNKGQIWVMFRPHLVLFCKIKIGQFQPMGLQEIALFAFVFAKSAQD
jgi:hypothetical protein